MNMKPVLVPLKEKTVGLLVDECERLMNMEAKTKHPAIKEICRKKFNAILYLIDEQNQRS